MSAGGDLPRRSFADVAAILTTRGLSPDEARGAFEGLLAGEWTSVQIGAFAMALRVRGEEEATIVAAAEALRAAMIPVDHGLERVMDTCGTGGDGAGTLNVSTAAAIVVAAAGVPVAKHGTRSVSSRCGSADVVEALGIPTDLPPERQASVLRRANIAFLLAPAHHPALRHAADARRQLGIRTIFNALGPLANPARATHQLLGVYDDALRPMAARALRRMGVTRVWVVRSTDGLDELSPAAPTRVTEATEDEVRERIVAPADFGAKESSLAALAGGDARANAAAITCILQREAHPAAEAVLLNAAAAFVVADAMAPKDAFERARAVVASGAAAEALEGWRLVAREARG